ncbi:FxSxx-COOH system tetratricopeptide repeat protein [Kitasatospora albolonga]|uniref:tetratricopeptide repeat protein n=1 Tax=Kitasatospora albolonga TaxID=68173 RepID=UPI0031ED576C
MKRPGTPPRPGRITASGDHAIAAQTFIGNAYTGDNPTVINLPPSELRPPAEVDAPPHLAHLPARHASFVGRERELALLDSALDGTGTAVVQALHGLGGVGKSTLAAHWAATRAGTDNPVWWITADNPANLDAGLARLATALQPALALLPAEQLTERAVQWLATHTGWLLILDNVDDPAHLAPLLARATTGRILITSRRATGWHHTAVPVPLDVLSPEESLALLRRIVTAAGTRTAALDGAAELCTELGHLPLAVEQAGAYIAETGISPAAYLHLLAEDPALMYGEAAEGHDGERTVARVWRLSLDHLTEHTPLTGDVLSLLAWCASTNIPRALLTPLDTAPAVHRAIGRLAAYSLITVNGDTLAVHRLVQSLARTPDPDDPHRLPEHIASARDLAVVLVSLLLPTDPEAPATWPAWRALLPHVDAIASHSRPDADSEAMAALFASVGLFLADQGDVRPATAYLERAHTIRVRLLGEDHLDTQGSRNNLARAYESTGDLARAIPLYEQTLDTVVRVLGDDDPMAFKARNNLAGAYSSIGDLDRAVPLYERALGNRLQVLGEDDPEILTYRNNLASAYESRGELARAIPLFEQNLIATRRVLGEDHPRTLDFRGNLAGAYESDGDLTRAVPLYEQNLDESVRVLGDSHPGTMLARNNLGYAYLASGDQARALPLYEQTLADRSRVLGEDHPDTLTSRNNLAFAYQAAGEPAKVVALYEQAVTSMARVLGESHPNTLTARNNLATAYTTSGDPARGLPLYESTLADRTRVLGDEHPDTLRSRHNLGVAYLRSARIDRAITLLKQTLAVRFRLFGAEHPDTVLTRDSLTAAILIHTERPSDSPPPVN